MEERNQIKMYRRAHLDQQRTQQEKYYKLKHRKKALDYPNKYLSIIMDGMDQKKTYLPVLQQHTKDVSPLHQCLIGVKVHGKFE